MDWPHDPDGDEGSEGRRKYGQAVLAKKLDEDEDFPLTATEFVDEFGDADIFEHVDEEEFADFPDFHAAVGEALREADYWPYRLEHA